MFFLTVELRFSEDYIPTCLASSREMTMVSWLCDNMSYLDKFMPAPNLTAPQRQSSFISCLSNEAARFGRVEILNFIFEKYKVRIDNRDETREEKERRGKRGERQR